MDNVRKIAAKIPRCSVGKWDAQTKSKIPQMLAGMFAFYTMQKSGASFNQLQDIDRQAGDKKLLLRPHNIQVLSILRLLRCQETNGSTLDSQLMEIRTSEGKSILLGATATLLALLGFRIRCVCYSEYLSERDHDLFEAVFDAFHVSDRIKYSTITTFSEDTTTAKGDIRGLTQQLIAAADLLPSKQNNVKLSGDKKRRRKVVEGPAGSSLKALASEASSNGKRISGAKRKRGQSSALVLDHNGPRQDEEILLVDEVCCCHTCIPCNEIALLGRCVLWHKLLWTNLQQGDNASGI